MVLLATGLCPSMTDDVLQSLKAQGIKEVLDFVSTNPERITALCGLPYKKVLAIRRVLLAQYSSFSISGLDLLDDCVATLAVLPTGCGKLDEVLVSGIYTGEVTEILGSSASGKTQFCQSFAVNVAATLEQNIIYIDTSGGSSIRRMTEICECRLLDRTISSTLSRIKHCCCFDLDEFLEILASIRSQIHQQDGFYTSLKVLIIDSIAAILGCCTFHASFITGLAKIQAVGRELNSLAKEFAVAVIVVNDMVSDSNSTIASTRLFSRKPALGRCWTFVPSVRLLLSTGEEASQIRSCEIAKDNRKTQEFTATLLKSPRSGRLSAVVSLSHAGCQDAFQL